MKRGTPATLALLFVTTTVFATTADNGESRYKTFKGSYSLYSGELGDSGLPHRRDTKISMWVRGPVAKEMFDAMGPDDKAHCEGAPGERSRTKENIWCTYSRQEGYTCTFGFDLKTGRSIGGSIC